MMRSILAVFLCGVLLVCFAGCDLVIEIQSLFDGDSGGRVHHMWDDQTSGSGDSSNQETSVSEITMGKLIFMQHGLEDDDSCFNVTSRNLAAFGNYVDVSAKTNVETLNQMLGEGKNVLIRTKFSAGNLSFDAQLKELGNIVQRFAGHSADEVIFVGHSMGGLTSINYALEYYNPGSSPDSGISVKNIDITVITVDTPYYPNNYAALAWMDPTGLGAQFLAGQKRGDAHRDLAGFKDDSTGNIAMDSIRDKWNSHTSRVYTRAGVGNKIQLHAIAISLHAENSGEDISGIGDGIVDIPAQLGYSVGYEWKDVVGYPIIYGTKGKNNPTDWRIGKDSDDTSNPYHHINTPDLKEVAKLIHSIISKA